MTPDDPRHGTNAGYLTHYREGEKPCAACKRGKELSRKRLLGDHLRGEKLLYTSEEVRAAIAPWLAQGISPSAVAKAAGFGSQRGANLRRLFDEGGHFRRAAYHALAQVTEDDFPDSTKVNGDLTRHRIYSLMAAGHRLQDMPINPCGQWRSRTNMTVGTARAIRAHFREHEFQMGDCNVTRRQALNAGHQPPLAWDDPGTLGWPDGVRPVAGPVAIDAIDHAVVARLVAGERVQSTRAEKEAAMARWLASGRPEKLLCETHGWKAGRYVPRDEDAA